MNTPEAVKKRSAGLLGRIRARAGFLGAITVFAAASAARADELTSPPDPQKPWFQWLFTVAFLVLCCVVAFKNPKRSHLG